MNLWVNLKLQVMGIFIFFIYFLQAILPTIVILPINSIGNNCEIELQRLCLQILQKLAYNYITVHESPLPMNTFFGLKIVRIFTGTFDGSTFNKLVNISNNEKFQFIDKIFNNEKLQLVNLTSKGPSILDIGKFSRFLTPPP